MACPSGGAVFRHDFGRCPLDHAVLTPLDEDPLVGLTLAGRYVIDGCVGEGGMGRVYRARHRNLDRLFAVKVLYGDLAANAKMRLRFDREARAASRVDHPHLVSVLDSGITDTGLLYLVMSYVEGRELGEIIADEAPLTAERVTRLVRQLCQGLAHAHDQGLVHRDFKGQNVLVSGTGEAEHVRILDFGLAFMRLEPESSRITTQGVVMGTPAYRSPEQATGSEMDHRTDLFSLGVLIYEMLAGTLPFDGTPVELARQNLAAEPPPIARRVPGLDVDAGLERIAHRLMRKLPRERYQSAHEVMVALDIVAAGDQGTHAVPALSSTAGSGPSGPSSTRDAARRVSAAAAGVDTTGETQSMEQEQATALAAAPESPAVPDAPDASESRAAPDASESRAAPESPAAPDAPARAMPSVPARKGALIATKRVRAGRRPPLAVGVAVGLLALVVVVVLLARGGRETELAVVTPEPAVDVPPAEPAARSAVADAGAAPATATVAAAGSGGDVPDPDASYDKDRSSGDGAVPDSGQATAAAPEPSRPRGARRPRRGQSPPGPGTEVTRAPAEPPGPGEGSSAAAEVEAMYKRVGQKLAGFERAHGAAAARPWWAVYSSIPLLDAMRTPSVGQDALRTLRRLERDLAAAGSRP